VLAWQLQSSKQEAQRERDAYGVVCNMLGRSLGLFAREKHGKAPTMGAQACCGKHIGAGEDLDLVATQRGFATGKPG
jgi:hypothetical protein